MKTFFLGMFVCLALAGVACQTQAATTIGVLLPTKGLPCCDLAHASFKEELARQGFGPDQVDILLQQPAPTTMAWTNAARKFVTLDVKIIVTHGAATTLAALNETSSIPIVYVAVYDPTALGITGNNITGTGAKVPVPGLIKNFKRIANFARLGIIYSSEEKDTELQAAAVEALSSQLGFQVVRHDIKDEGDNIKLPEAEAVFLTTASNVIKNIAGIIAQAQAQKVPTAALLGHAAEQGVILTLYANPEQEGREAAAMVAEILRGKAPAAIPANNSPKIEMAINLKEAKDLGLNIPFDLLGTAKVIK